MSKRVRSHAAMVVLGMAVGATVVAMTLRYPPRFPSHKVTFRIDNPTGDPAWACIAETAHGRASVGEISPGGSIDLPALYAIHPSEVTEAHVIVFTHNADGPLSLPVSRQDKDPIQPARLTIFPALNSVGGVR